MRGRDDEALASTLDDEAASATSGDDTCRQRLEYHGFLLPEREAKRPSDLGAIVWPRPPRKRNQVIGSHSSRPIVQATIAFEYFGCEPRQGCSAAARATRCGGHHGFDESLVDAVERQPRACRTCPCHARRPKSSQCHGCFRAARPCRGRSARRIQKRC